MEAVKDDLNMPQGFLPLCLGQCMAINRSEAAGLEIL